MYALFTNGRYTFDFFRIRRNLSRMSKISKTIVENDVKFDVIAQDNGKNDCNTALVFEVVR